MRALGGWFIILLFGAGAIGWITNIVKLTELDFATPYKAEVVRVIGIVPPVGAIVGYLTIGEEKEPTWEETK